MVRGCPGLFLWGPFLIFKLVLFVSERRGRKILEGVEMTYLLVGSKVFILYTIILSLAVRFPAG